MKTVRSAHDAFFRGSMSNLQVAKEFVQSYVSPAIVQALDLDSLRLMPTSYVDETLKASFSDVVYQAKLKDGGYAYICTLLFEHQSTVDPLMPLRIWRYVINIWVEHVKQHKGSPPALPLVVPVVFYSGKGPYTGATNLKELIQAPPALIEEALFQETFKLIELNQLSEEAFKQHQWVGTMAWVLRHVRDPDILVSLRHLVDTLRNLEAAGGTDFVILLLNYCLTTGETRNLAEIETFKQIVQQQLSPETGEKIMTIAEQLIAKGEARGEAKGEARGEARGEAKGLVQGELKALRRIAQRCFAKGHTLVYVHELTGLPEEELQVLQHSNIH